MPADQAFPGMMGCDESYLIQVAGRPLAYSLNHGSGNRFGVWVTHLNHLLFHALPNVPDAAESLGDHKGITGFELVLSPIVVSNNNVAADHKHVLRERVVVEISTTLFSLPHTGPSHNLTAMIIFKCDRLTHIDVAWRVCKFHRRRGTIYQCDRWHPGSHGAGANIRTNAVKAV